MNYKNYIKDNKLILPKGFNSGLFCSCNDLSELILPKGFNSDLFCSSNNLTELILPEGFNSTLLCYNNNLSELILSEGFNSYLVCDNTDIYKIANCMKEFKLNYFNAGIKIIDQLDLNKLPKLKSHFRNLKLNILLNEL